MSDAATVTRRGREVEDSMTKVYVFCFRAPVGGFWGYFGFGLSPDEAVSAAKRAGLSAKDMKKTKCKMIRLPEGVTKYAMTDVGSVQWEGPDTMAKDAVSYVYDAKARTWVEEVAP